MRLSVLSAVPFLSVCSATVPTVPEYRVLVPQHAGSGLPGSEGTRGPEHPTKNAPDARRAQLGEAEL